eukprot:1416015-Prymnesium_polylepis.2
MALGSARGVAAAPSSAEARAGPSASGIEPRTFALQVQVQVDRLNPLGHCSDPLGASLAFQLSGPGSSLPTVGIQGTPTPTTPRSRLPNTPSSPRSSIHPRNFVSGSTTEDSRVPTDPRAAAHPQFPHRCRSDAVS